MNDNLEETTHEVLSSPPSRCNRCCGALRCINSMAPAVLLGIIVFLFLQLQYLTYRVNTDEDQLKALELRLQNQTQGQIEVLTAKVDQEHSLTLYQMAGTFTLLTCLLTAFHMSTHLRHFYQPFIQRKVVTLLWLSPVYSLTSFFSLVFPSADGYLAVIKDFYEAYAIFTFLSFLIAVLGKGDRQTAVEVLSEHADHLKRPMRCLNQWYHPPPSTSPFAKANAVVTECQILCMQFVFLRPLTSIASFVSTTVMQQHYQGSDHTEDHTLAYFKTPSFYLAMVTNVSVGLAFTGLLKFYHAVAEDLKWCQPFSKFLTIKGIVFLTFWQGLLISILVASLDTDVDALEARESALQMQNFLICLEMLFFAIAHYCVFPAEEWEPQYRPTKYAAPGIGIKDFVDDVGYIIKSRRQARSFEEVDSDDEDNGEDPLHATEDTSLEQPSTALETNFDEEENRIQ